MRNISLFFLFFFTLVFVCGGCVCSSQFHPSLPGPALASEITSETVALVSNFDADDSLHQIYCTGVWVGENTILTAAHCVKGYADMKQKKAMAKALKATGLDPDMAEMFITMGLADLDPSDPRIDDQVRALLIAIKSVPPVEIQGLDMPYIVEQDVVDFMESPKEIHKANEYAIDEREDLALLSIAGPTHKHKIAKLADSTPLIGERVAVLGHANGAPYSYVEGIVSTYRKHMPAVLGHDGPFLEISASITHGDSGAGIFNDRGEYVGTISFTGPEGVYCIHLDTVRGFLIGAHVIKAKLNLMADNPDLDNTVLN
jgi:hypothetical protein